VAKGDEKSKKVEVWHPLPNAEVKPYSELHPQIERRNPENALIRRWFALADRVLGRKHDSENPDK